MTITDKLHSFTPTEVAIHIFKEGIFAKMYNESAFLFTQYFKKYQVNVSTSAREGRTSFSVGFPLQHIEHNFENCLVNKIDETYLIAKREDIYFTETDYLLWCEASKRDYAEIKEKKLKKQASAEMPIPVSVSEQQSEKSTLQEILDFRLESATPMECMLFIHKIQIQLHGTLPKLAGIQSIV